MKKNLFIILITITALISFNINVYAAFKDSGWGTRSAGMGGAFAGVANNSDAPLWNPSGIAQMKDAEASFMYATLFSGLDLKAGDDKVTLGLNYLSFVYPKSGLGAFGVSWANFTASNLYKEDTYVLTYAKKLNDWFSMPPIVYLGLNLKLLNHAYTLDKYAQSDPVFANGNSKGGFTIDVGTLVKPFDRFAFGLTAKNLTQPDVGLESEDKVPMELIVGAAYRYTKITPAVNVSMRDGEVRYHVGVESWLLNKMLGLRAGYNPTEAALGFSFNGIRGKTLGLNVDYSFILPLQVEDATSHRVSLGIWF